MSWVSFTELSWVEALTSILMISILINIEIAVEKADQRPALTLVDVDGADFFRVRVPRESTSRAFRLSQVGSFRVFGSQFVRDQESAHVDDNAT